VWTLEKLIGGWQMTEAETKTAMEHLERQIKSAIAEFESATGIPITKVQLVREADKLNLRVISASPR
jgi:hypothetical protein